MLIGPLQESLSFVTSLKLRRDLLALISIGSNPNVFAAQSVSVVLPMPGEPCKKIHPLNDDEFKYFVKALFAFSCPITSSSTLGLCDSESILIYFTPLSLKTFLYLS
jgi:hypothetical protein